jgi:hypothetical protein
MIKTMLWAIDNDTLLLVPQVYFITMTTLLEIIGSEYCKCAAKFDLLYGKDVKLNRMTRWLRSVDILICIYKVEDTARRCFTRIRDDHDDFSLRQQICWLRNS